MLGKIWEEDKATLCQGQRGVKNVCSFVISTAFSYPKNPKWLQPHYQK